MKYILYVLKCYKRKKRNKKVDKNCEESHLFIYTLYQFKLRHFTCWNDLGTIQRISFDNNSTNNILSVKRRPLIMIDALIWFCINNITAEGGKPKKYILNHWQLKSLSTCIHICNKMWRCQSSFRSGPNPEPWTRNLVWSVRTSSFGIRKAPYRCTRMHALRSSFGFQR